MLTLTTWNMDFASPSSMRSKAMRRFLAVRSPDIVVMTEAFTDTLNEDGHVICSAKKYGYEGDDKRRNVILWSRSCWRDIDNYGSPDLPLHRIVAGTTETPIGPVRVLGVCVPWQDPTADSEQRNLLCEDYVRCLAALDDLLHRDCAPERLIIAGNWSSRRSVCKLPIHVRDARRRTFRHLFVPTAGVLSRLSRFVMADVAHTRDLTSLNVACAPECDDRGNLVSDHFGTEVWLRRASDMSHQRPTEERLDGVEANAEPSLGFWGPIAKSNASTT